MLTDGQKRAYLLRVPKRIPSDRPVPLVICLHGFAEWPAHVMRLSHWNQLADEFGFLVVYPRGSGFPFRWRCSGLFGKPEEQFQDVQFISDLIDQLKTEYKIDESRIYASGLSNGGGMAFLLACRLSERIAAIGGVAGAYVLPWTSLQCTNVHRRAYAARALANFGVAATDAAPQLQHALSDPTQEVSDAARKALVRIAPERLTNATPH